MSRGLNLNRGSNSLNSASDYFKTPTRRLTVLHSTLCIQNFSKICSHLWSWKIEVSLSIAFLLLFKYSYLRLQCILQVGSVYRIPDPTKQYRQLLYKTNYICILLKFVLHNFLIYKNLNKNQKLSLCQFLTLKEKKTENKPKTKQPIIEIENLRS